MFFQRKRKRLDCSLNRAVIYAGNYLLSHTVPRAVQSAQRGLTSVFGMGTGGTPAVRSPTSYRDCVSAIPCPAGHHRLDDVREIFLKDPLPARNAAGVDIPQLNRLVQLCKSTSHAIFQRQAGDVASPNAVGKFY